MATHMGAFKAVGGDGYTTAREAAMAAMRGIREPVKLVMTFASYGYDLAAVLRGIREVTGDAPLIGCTSAGEFTREGAVVGSVAVTVVASDSMQVRVGSGHHLRRDMKAAVAAATATFAGTIGDEVLRTGMRGRTLFLMTDGLAGGAEDLVDELMNATGMKYQLFGGAAADNLAFKETFVLVDDQVLTDAFVCAEVLSEQPVGIGLQHGWEPRGAKLRVTRARGTLLQEINGAPAWQAFAEFAQREDLAIAPGSEAAFLMDHPVGICEDDVHKLRVPLFKHADGSLTCAAEVPEGCVVQIMAAEVQPVIDSGAGAVERARADLDGSRIAGALAFECVATLIKLGDRFSDEVSRMKAALAQAPFMGCNSFGQLARIRGRFSGMMEATALVCLIPE